MMMINNTLVLVYDGLGCGFSRRSHARLAARVLYSKNSSTYNSANSRKGKKDFHHHLSRLKTDASRRRRRQEIIKKDLEPGTCLQILENIEASH